MYHTIEFHGDWIFDLEIAPIKPLERLRIRNGTRLAAQLKPYVIDTPSGQVEVADLFFTDGTAVRSVPFSRISFVND